MYTRARISDDGKTVGEGLHFERVRRVTGYLVGTLDRFNDGKRAEVDDRVKHMHMPTNAPKQREINLTLLGLGYKTLFLILCLICTQILTNLDAIRRLNKKHQKF